MRTAYGRLPTSASRTPRPVNASCDSRALVNKRDAVHLPAESQAKDGSIGPHPGPRAVEAPARADRARAGSSARTTYGYSSRGYIA